MSDDERSIDDLEAALDKAISEWMVRPGQVLSRFVIVAEVMDVEDGDRDIIVDQSEGMMLWDVGGILSWALNSLDDEDEEDE